MKELINAWKTVDRNVIAAIFSVVPGLGHVYKHHYLQGMCLLIVGNVLVLFIAGLMALGTFGLSLVVVPAVWFAGIGYSAYMATDEHGNHPWLHIREHHWGNWIKRLARR